MHKSSPQKNNGFGLTILVLAFTVASTGTGCCPAKSTQRPLLPDGKLGPRDVLFDRNGREYDCPKARWGLAIYNAPDVVKAKEMIDLLVDVLAGEGEVYSRYVAAKVLVGLYQATHPKEPPTSLISRRGIEVIAQKVIRPNSELPDVISPEQLSVSGDVEFWGFRVIDPHCVMWVDAEYMIIRRGMPAHWQAEDAEVILDGRVIIRRKGPMGLPATVFIDIREFLRPETMIGRHVLTVSMTLVAPNGIKTRIKRDHVFIVKERRKREED